MRQFPGQPLPRSDGFNIDPMFSNPAGTYPFPAPGSMPYTQWQSARTPLNWTNPSNSLDTAYATVGYWQSPLYDLRPEIRGADGSTPSGVPIWSSGGRKLFIQIQGLLSLADGITATQDLKVSAREYGEIFDARQLQRVTPDSDITADIAAGGNTQPPSIILSFSPNEAHGNYRYWRVELAFKRLDRTTHPITISGAFY
jgi:hypothetical protein